MSICILKKYLTVFKVENGLIVSFKSKSIKLEGLRDKSFEEVFCMAKQGGRILFDNGGVAEMGEPGCYADNCKEYEACKNTTIPQLKF